jgi:hypothetical protein
MNKSKQGHYRTKKGQTKGQVLNEKKPDEIGARLEHSSRKFLGYLAQATGISKMTPQMP